MPHHAGHTGRMSPWASTGRFETLGTSHLAVWGLFVVGVVLMVLLGRRVRGTERAPRVSRAFALTIPALLVPLQVIDFLPGNYNVETTLPVNLCDLAWVAAAVALWTGHRIPVALTYYWGLLLTTQALLTPTLHADFPDPKFFAFWGMHMLIVWAAVYLTWGLGLRPTWRGYRSTVVVTGVWLVSVYAFNELVGTNYGYVNGKPGTASILDLFGPWPWYVAVEIAVAAIAWALMTWPWESREPAPTTQPAAGETRRRRDTEFWG
jgi:hypothetical integral membrane protein (TIGR02206 family)